jgi:hypothetical protein
MERPHDVTVRPEDAMRLVVVPREQPGDLRRRGDGRAAQGFRSMTQRNPRWLLPVLTSPLPRVPIM